MPETVDQILLRFPGPVTLYPSRKKWIAVLLGALAFVVIGVLMLQSGSQDAATAWGGIIFFGLGIPISIGAMLPNASRLTLAKEGFEAVALYRGTHVLWTEVANFAVAPLPLVNKPMLQFDYTPSQNPGSRTGWLLKMTRGKGALPDTYGFNQNDLARLMNAWRERALR